jgi:hypothetical protein
VLSGGDEMKLFELRREVDESGVSGTGVVAQGIIFDNGKIAMTWLSRHTSVAVYDNMEQVIGIHGHGGKTKVVQIADLAEFPIMRSNWIMDEAEGGCRVPAA